jgi:hypothetical protein
MGGEEEEEMPFQPELAPALSGTANATVMSQGLNPTTILSVNTPWSIQLNWSMTGLLASSIGGDWRLQAFVESMGVGFEGLVAGPLSIPVTFAPIVNNTRTYVQNLPVPANPAIGVGAYKLVVTITHVNAGVPTQIAAYMEGPILQFIA